MEIARRTHSNLIDIVRIIFQQIKDDLAVRYSVCPCYMSTSPFICCGASNVCPIFSHFHIHPPIHACIHLLHGMESEEAMNSSFECFSEVNGATHLHLLYICNGGRPPVNSIYSLSIHAVIAPAD